MLETQSDPIVDTIINDFGANYVFALDLLEQYRGDPGSVEPSWREYFDRITGAPSPPAAAAPPPPEPAPDGAESAIPPSEPEPAATASAAPAASAPGSATVTVEAQQAR